MPIGALPKHQVVQHSGAMRRYSAVAQPRAGRFGSGSKVQQHADAISCAPGGSALGGFTAVVPAVFDAGLVGDFADSS